MLVAWLSGETSVLLTKELPKGASNLTLSEAPFMPFDVPIE
jgi:hypothetical protein